jgi:multiple sugar transport system substrate-binding protein
MVKVRARTGSTEGGAVRRAVLQRGARLALLTPLVSLAGACVPGAPDAGGTGGSGGRAALSGTVQILHNPAFPFNADVGGEIAQAFSERHPQVRVDSQPLSGNAVEKITAAVAGGDAPEMVTVGTHEVQELAASGAVRTLEPWLKGSRTLKKADIWPTLVDDFTYKGQAYGIPYGPDLRILYVSVDKYRRAGLDPARPAKTWAEFEDAILKVHRGVAGGEIETLGFDPFLGSGGVYRWLVPYWQLGGELLSPDKEKVTLNNERAVEALTWLKKVVDSQGGYEKIQGFARGSTYQQLFINNRVAHMYATYAERAQEWQAKAPQLEFSYFSYPLPPNGRRANYGGGHTFPVLSGSKNPDAAWAFIEFLSEEENSIKFTDRYDRIPLRASTVRSEKWHRNDPFRKLAAEEMQGRRFVIAAPGGAEALTAQGSFVTEIMLNRLSIREGLAQAQTQIQQILDKWRR